ncbi:hypothetical protein M422DRAFT_241610 [Sphaerobolus stellatus SS14]|nr:hypothetical protein M422DRAFT_241610 [Sphaerobolus stellatus SS14]
MKTVGTASVFVLLISCVFCNTEIVNFDLNHLPDLAESVSSSWGLLTPLSPSNKRTYHVEVPEIGCPVRSSGDQVAPADTWFGLNIPRTLSAKRYTLRISWPATMPVNFDIQVFRVSHASDGAAFDQLPTPYARIKTSSAGIRSNCSGSGVLPSTDTIHFDVILEPLIAGVLPESLIPTILSLFPITAIFWVLAQHIESHLRRTAREAEISYQKKL